VAVGWMIVAVGTAADGEVGSVTVAVGGDVGDVQADIAAHRTNSAGNVSDFRMLGLIVASPASLELNGSSDTAS